VKTDDVYLYVILSAFGGSFFGLVATISLIYCYMGKSALRQSQHDSKPTSGAETMAPMLQTDGQF
jgi:hypothetical protein